MSVLAQTEVFLPRTQFGSRPNRSPPSAHSNHFGSRPKWYLQGFQESPCMTVEAAFWPVEAPLIAVEATDMPIEAIDHLEHSTYVCMLSLDEKRVIRGIGRLFWEKLCIYLAICSSYKSWSFTIFRCLNKGLVCALYWAPVMICFDLFCSIHILLMWVLWVEP